MSTNREYRDSLFKRVFGDSSQRASLLSLYNALNGTHYANPEDVTINTLEDVVYVHIKNDVSFILDGRITLLEQQSSVNPNMPIRGFLYFSRLYENYISANKINLYGSRLKRLPAPQYFVFYNGTEAMPARQELRLSDSFETESDTLECVAKVINLNDAANAELISRCKPLSDYVTFVSGVKEQQSKGCSLKEAIDTMVDWCIEHDILRDILLKDKEGVTGVVLEEFDEELYKKDLFEEGLEQGIKQGVEQGIKQGVEQGIKQGIKTGMVAMLYKLVHQNQLTLEQGASNAEMSVEDFREGYLAFAT